MALPAARFDRGNLDVRRHNVAWKRQLNAANFAADVADLCVTRYTSAVISPTSPTLILPSFLAAVRQLATPPSSMVIPTNPVFGRFAGWQPADDSGKALKTLLELVFKLYWQTDRRPTSIAKEAGRWVYTWALDSEQITEAEIETFEIQHRIADRVTPPSENCRQAFEAVWALGKFRDAIKLLHRKES